MEYQPLPDEFYAEKNIDPKDNYAKAVCLGREIASLTVVCHVHL